MGKKCCVSKCVYNPGNPTSVFQFPSDENLKTVRLKNIGRKDVFNTECVGVCILHFEAKFIKRVNDSGNALVRPRLKDNAIPTIFNYNTDGISDIFDHDVIDAHLIRDFHHFKYEHRNHTNLFDWSTFIDELSISFYKIRLKNDGNLISHYNIHIDYEMNIEIFHNGESMDIDHFKDIITRRKKLYLFSELKQIIERCEEFECVEQTEPAGLEKMKKHLKSALKCLTEAKVVIKPSKITNTRTA